MATLSNLVTEATKILEVPRDLVGPCLDEAVAAEEIVRETVPATGGQIPAVYPLPFHRAERSLAAGLLDLLTAREDRMPAFQDVDWVKALDWLKRGRTTGGSTSGPDRAPDLAPEQQDAVRLALTTKVAVLTGGPGCGKSFTVRSIVRLARARQAKIVLAAPTGRAAKRLAEPISVADRCPTSWFGYGPFVRGGSGRGVDRWPGR